MIIHSNVSLSNSPKLQPGDAAAKKAKPADTAPASSVPATNVFPAGGTAPAAPVENTTVAQAALAYVHRIFLTQPGAALVAQASRLPGAAAELLSNDVQ